MSQEVAAQKLEITKQTLIEYEAGRGNPSLRTVQRICEVYNISPNYLISGDDNNISRFEEPLKRKAYFLFSLLVDNDLSFSQVDSKLTFINQELKKAIAYSCSILEGNSKLTKLEAIDMAIQYLESLVQS